MFLQNAITLEPLNGFWCSDMQNEALRKFSRLCDSKWVQFSKTKLKSFERDHLSLLQFKALNVNLHRKSLTNVNLHRKSLRKVKYTTFITFWYPIFSDVCVFEHIFHPVVLIFRRSKCQKWIPLEILRKSMWCLNFLRSFSKRWKVINLELLQIDGINIKMRPFFNGTILLTRTA